MRFQRSYSARLTFAIYCGCSVPRPMRMRIESQEHAGQHRACGCFALCQLLTLSEKVESVLNHARLSQSSIGHKTSASHRQDLKTVLPTNMAQTLTRSQIGKDRTVFTSPLSSCAIGSTQGAQTGTSLGSPLIEFHVQFHCVYPK